MKKRNPFIASIFSFFCPGLGQIYNSQIKFGFIVLATAYFILGLSVINNYFIYIFCTFGWIIIWIFSIIYAFIKAIKIKEAQLTKFNKWILYLFLILVGFPYVYILVVPNIKFQNYNMPAGSMKPTLIVGDYIVVNRNYYKNNEPKYGDIIVFKSPEDNNTDYIKRVIGLPGDTIQIVNGEIIINKDLIYREKINDFVDIDSQGNEKRIRRYKEYLYGLEIEVLDIMDNGIVDNTKIYEIPEDHFFVMGDNRDNSLDSRFINKIGYVPRENILHKLYMIYWSGDKSRIGLFPK